MAAEAKTAPKMHYKRLGKTGLQVSELCLGTMTFGVTEGSDNIGLPVTSEAESHAMLDRFVEAGGNFIDTADGYGAGTSEVIIGKWLAKKGADFRKRVIIATKVFFPDGPYPNAGGVSRAHIMNAVEGSLKRLQTPYIDLYQAHCWDEKVPLEETLQALNDLVTAGKVRYIGVSNYTGWQLQKAIAISEARGWAPISCLQPLYNALERSTEWDLVEVCSREGVGIIPWSPLAGGWLSGRYNRNTKKEDLAGTRIEWAEKVQMGGMSYSSRANEYTWGVIDAVTAVAKEVNATPAQVSLRWLMQKKGVTAPIVGAKKLTHLEDNLGVLKFSLTDAQMAAIDKASDMPPPYPWAFIRRFQ